MAKKKAERDTKQERQPKAEPAQPTQAPEPVRLKRGIYRQELGGLQVEMFKLQQWIAGEGLRAVVLLEGLGPAGKAGTAQAIVEGLHKRVGQVVTLEPPRKRERGQWQFQRYVEHFPRAGQIVIFDGSWYHYPAMERTLGMCGEPDFPEFLRLCEHFEQVLAASGVTLIKYWFTAEEEEQNRRFHEHVDVLMKHRGFYLHALEQNCEPQGVAAVRDMVLAHTDRPGAQWYVVRADDKRRARLNCLRHLISLVPGENAAEAGAPETSAAETGAAGQAPRADGATPEAEAQATAPAMNGRVVPEVY